jgi:hypothetical protein
MQSQIAPKVMNKLVRAVMLGGLPVDKQNNFNSHFYREHPNIIIPMCFDTGLSLFESALQAQRDFLCTAALMQRDPDLQQDYQQPPKKLSAYSSRRERYNSARCTHRTIV